MTRRRLVLAAYALLFLFTAFQSVRRIYTLSTDFDGFWRAGKGVLAGNGPYASTAGPSEDRLLFPGLRKPEEPGPDNESGTDSAVRRYLPFFALMMAPLALLPMDVACLLWHALSFASLFAGVKCAFRLAGREESLDSNATLAVLAGSVFFWADTFTMGQIGLVTLALSLASIDVARTRPWIGGALAGLAAAIKVTPAVVGVYFLLKRRWAAAAASFSAFLLCAALAIPVWGPSQALELHRTWIAESASTAGPGFFERGESLRYQNQSLHAWAARLLMDVNAGRGKKPFQVNIARLSPATVGWVVRVLQIPLALLCLTAFLARRPGEPLRLSEAGLLLPVTVFISPIAWTFHLVVVIPALACFWEHRDEKECRMWFTAVTILELGLVLPWTRAVGLPMFACLAAAFGSWRVAMRERTTRSSPAP